MACNNFFTKYNSYLQIAAAARLLMALQNQRGGKTFFDLTSFSSSPCWQKKKNYNFTVFTRLFCFMVLWANLNCFGVTRKKEKVVFDIKQSIFSFFLLNKKNLRSPDPNRRFLFHVSFCCCWFWLPTNHTWTVDTWGQPYFVFWLRYLVWTNDTF